MELFLAVAASLGAESDRDVAALAGVSVENVANWRGGAVQEFKREKLAQVRRALEARIAALTEKARALDRSTSELRAIEVEVGSSPAEQQRLLRDRVHYDYLGHRFLYFEAQGALAWKSLIKSGYDQSAWLRGVGAQARAWLDPARGASGARGPIADALGLGRPGASRGLDVISLGPGDGAKEVAVLEAIAAAEQAAQQRLPWYTLALVDVSISLLLEAATDARRKLVELGADHAHVLAFSADFEEGPLAFRERLPSEALERRGERDAALRLVLLLGNVLGNVREESNLLRDKLARLLRPGDLLWLEVGIKPERITQDPLYAMTEAARTETSSETHRRLLLEGPYRAWEAALGRQPARAEMRIWLREDDDSSRVPGSCNFCHDLVLPDERRTLTMLYSRRYAERGLVSWLEAEGYDVLAVEKVEDEKRRPRVMHLLCRRR